MFNKIKKECKKHHLCKDCPLYLSVNLCGVQSPPEMWNRKELKRMLKKGDAHDKKRKIKCM